MGMRCAETIDLANTYDSHGRLKSKQSSLRHRCRQTRREMPLIAALYLGFDGVQFVDEGVSTGCSL